MNGVTFAASRVTLKKMTDGTTKTFFAGEKSLQPRFYLGGGPTDNGSLYEGHDYDVLRWAGKDGNNTTSKPYTGLDMLPLQDKNALKPDNTLDDDWGRINFGSAHSSGTMFVMCDGSVQMLSYNIDPQIFWKLSNRRDGLNVELP
jgi:prepilin-type processing-associated H-X9-DG protein